MKHLLLAVGICLLGALPQGAMAQATPMGVVVAADGNCPSGTALVQGVGRPLYGTSKGALCISGNITTTAAATAPYVFTSTGFQVLSVGASAIGFTPPATTTVCFIIPETQAVRYRTDGTNPTASVGVPQAVSTQLILTASLSTVKFIAQTGTSSVDIDCYK